MASASDAASTVGVGGDGDANGRQDRLPGAKFGIVWLRADKNKLMPVDPGEIQSNANVVLYREEEQLCVRVVKPGEGKRYAHFVSARNGHNHDVTSRTERRREAQQPEPAPYGSPSRWLHSRQTGPGTVISAAVITLRPHSAV